MNREINPLHKLAQVYAAMKNSRQKKAGWFKTAALALMYIAPGASPMSGFVKETDQDLPKNNSDSYPNTPSFIEVNDICIKQVCRQGAFYLDYSKYLQTKNIEKSVVYKTHAQAKTENICKQDLGYLSEMRESGGDPTLVGGSYMGLYQYGELSIHNAVLEALCAKNSDGSPIDSEIVKMCESNLLICPPDDPGYLRAKESAQASYAENIAKVAQCSKNENRYKFYNAVFAKGAKPRQKLVRYFKRGALLTSSFRLMSQKNPDVSARWQKSFLKTYMILSNYDIFNGKPLPILVSAAIAAGIHGGGPGKVKFMIENSHNEIEASRKITAMEDHPDKRVEKARRQMALYATEKQMAEAAFLTRDSSYLQAFERGKKHLLLTLALDVHLKKLRHMRGLSGPIVPTSPFVTTYNKVSAPYNRDSADLQPPLLPAKVDGRSGNSPKTASSSVSQNKTLPISLFLRQKTKQK